MNKVLIVTAAFATGILSLVVSQSTNTQHADMLGTYTFDWCAPGSTDGTQVFKNRKIIGCSGRDKANEYIADVSLEALCYVPSATCVSMRDPNTSAEQRREYAELARFATAKPGTFDRCTSQSSDGTIMYERHLSGNTGKNGCSPANTARSYNWVMNAGCVWLGRNLVGCVDLPPSLSREKVVAMINR